MLIFSQVLWPLLLLLGSTNVVIGSEEIETYIIHMDHCRKPAAFSTLSCGTAYS
uniref:Uncharacterized protein n=1 Tax=Rhizophora mucronata TaxID=61149 RepID=A0A2P2IXR1_RHIMU